jgi:hypothetical protein
MKIKNKMLSEKNITKPIFLLAWWLSSYINSCHSFTTPLPAPITCTDPTEKLEQPVALNYLFSLARIRTSSSAACSDRNHPRCTSLEQVNCNTIAQIIHYKLVSSCRTAITGF